MGNKKLTSQGRRKRSKASKSQQKRHREIKIAEQSIDVETASRSQQPSPPLMDMETALLQMDKNPRMFEPINVSTPPASNSQMDVSTSRAITNQTNVLAPRASSSEDLSFSFISEEEYNRTMEHTLQIETVRKAPEEIKIEGNRIVDLQYLLNTVLEIQYKHTRICSLGKLVIEKECNRGLGLASKITLQCEFCLKTYIVKSEDPKKEISQINQGAVWGTLAAGTTRGHMNQMLVAMNIPAMNYRTFKSIEATLEETWKDSLWNDMELAGKEELEYAKQNNNFDKDGVYFSTVYVDAGWSRRTYGHNYNAASGVAVIIGWYTRKVLFVGVRNKYCCICARAANKQLPVGVHKCFKNWAGSSSAMEADIIVEGFKLSEEMHGVRYTCMIGDGDSSVFAKIRQEVSYGQTVKKLECTNHVVKNYGKALYAIKKDQKINIRGRKLLTGHKIEELQKIVQRAIYENQKDNLNMLKEDFVNGPLHVFGQHEKCKNYYCNNIGQIDPNFHSYIETGLQSYISSALDKVIFKASRLIDNETNNIAESFMSIVARFNSGKRLNLIQRNSFETRAYLSGLRFNKGPEWQISPWKRACGSSPGKHFKNYIHRESHKKKLKYGKKRRMSTQNHPKEINRDYGKHAEDVELSKEEFEVECNRKLNELKVTEDEIQKIQINTVGQFENPEYLCQKKNRLTASIFGNVIKRKLHTSCDVLVKQILKDPGIRIETEAMKYGNRHEATAIKMFEQCTKSSGEDIKVTKCGLYVDHEYFFLGASPDGITNTDALVEVKSLYSLATRGLSLIEACQDNKFRQKLCVKQNEAGEIELKLNHHYYYQIQGQLNICKKDMCYFIIFISPEIPIFVQEIRRDETLWTEFMVPKIKKFYMDCVLPEIVRGNRFKQLKCVDPVYVKEAKRRKLE